MLSGACLAGEKYRQGSPLRASFPGCCRVFKTRYSQGSAYKDIPADLLATALESLHLLWTPPPPRLPSWSGKKGILLTPVSQRGPSFLPVHPVSFTVPLAQDLDATGEQWAVEIPVRPVSPPGGKGLEAQGLNPAHRRFP